MLKRAYISAVIAAIAAIFGFSGWLDGAAPIAKGVSYAFGALCGLSLLFSLFEDADQPQLENQTQEPPQLAFQFLTEEPTLARLHLQAKVS